MADKRLTIYKVANKLVRQGKIEAAIKEYKKLIDMNPNDYDVRQILGDLYSKINRPKEAVQEFKKIADYYEKEGFNTKAIAMLKRITKIDPSDESTALKLAEIYENEGLKVEAKHIYLDLAENYKRLNNQKKALEIYQKILEFDRANVELRIKLAENFLKEEMIEKAAKEYSVITDILIKKNEFEKLENILVNAYEKIKDPRLFEKLIQTYIAKGEKQKAIEKLEALGDGLYNNKNLLKILADLYIENNKLDEVEKIYKKIITIDKNDIEIIIRLGKLYLQKKECEKAFELFLPTINENIEKGLIEEGISLARLIIASNNKFTPALEKLASIFKQTNKKNNLIAIYESMIPVYEEQGNKKRLIEILEELITLSDSPYTYKEQLKKLKGEVVSEELESTEADRESEFVNNKLRLAEESIKLSNYAQATSILIKAVEKYPQNIELRKKLVDIFQLSNDVDSSIEHALVLLDLYRSAGKNEEYEKLLSLLTNLKPDDSRITELSEGEKTDIDLDFGKEDVEEQIKDYTEDIKSIDHEESAGFNEFQIENNTIVDQSRQKVEQQEDQEDNEDVMELSEEETFRDIQEKIEKDISRNFDSQRVQIDFFINNGALDEAENLVKELLDKYPNNKFLKNKLIEIKNLKAEEVVEIDVSKDQPEEEDIYEISSSLTEESEIVQKMKAEEEVEEQKEVEKGEENEDKNEYEIQTIEPSKEYEDLKDFEIEFEDERNEKEEESIDLEIDKELLIQSPDPQKKLNVDEKEISSAMVEIPSIDDILNDDSQSSKSESAEKVFDEISGEVVFDSDEELLLGDDAVLFEDAKYFEIEKNIEDELSAIEFWIKEIEKQRTSTIEKNMTEIFEEFKKGIDEKIGQEDYDTRYNLGIAYKEMGLVEEAIHEFLISAKHPLKFFDSATLLGICFRDKGMFDESINWLEKALDVEGRKDEEYIAVKYELLITARLKEDFELAKKLAKEIMEKDPDFRDIKEIYNQLEKH